jgi:hypothetical protein
VAGAVSNLFVLGDSFLDRGRVTADYARFFGSASELRALWNSVWTWMRPARHDQQGGALGVTTQRAAGSHEIQQRSGYWVAHAWGQLPPQLYMQLPQLTFVAMTCASTVPDPASARSVSNVSTARLSSCSLSLCIVPPEVERV